GNSYFPFCRDFSHFFFLFLSWFYLFFHLTLFCRFLFLRLSNNPLPAVRARTPPHQRPFGPGADHPSSSSAFFSWFAVFRYCSTAATLANCSLLPRFGGSQSPLVCAKPA